MQPGSDLDFSIRFVASVKFYLVKVELGSIVRKATWVKLGTFKFLLSQARAWLVHAKGEEAADERMSSVTDSVTWVRPRCDKLDSVTSDPLTTSLRSIPKRW